MKKALLLILASALAAGCGNNEKSNFVKTDQIIDEVRSEFAPDRREKVFEINASAGISSLRLLGVTTEPEARDTLVSRLGREGIIFNDNITILPDKSLGDTLFGITALSAASFRYSPEHESESATQTIMGTPLRLLEKKNGWTRAVTPEGYIAWVTSGSIAETTEEGFKAWKESEKTIITSRAAIFRKHANENSEVISEGIAGNIVCKKGELPLYYKVMLPDGRTAYVSKSDAEDMDKWLATRRLTAENLIFAARQFSGIPYVWGGTSVKEMDCSGFIKTVFYLNGAIIPRDASQQAECGKDIDITKGLFDLRPGDLLFFGKKGTAGQKDRISHVGMYIGDNRFIHASTYVRTNSLMEGDSDYYVNTPNLVRVRRFIGCQDNGSGITSISAHPMYAK